MTVNSKRFKLRHPQPRADRGPRTGIPAGVVDATGSKKKKAVSSRQKAANKRAGKMPALPAKALPAAAVSAHPSTSPPTGASAAETTADNPQSEIRNSKFETGPNGYPLMSGKALAEFCDIDRSVATRRLRAAKIKPIRSETKLKLFEVTPEVEELLAESGDPRFDDVKLEDAQISKEIKRAKFEKMTGRSIDFNEACEYFGLLLKGLYMRFDGYSTSAAPRIRKLKSTKEVGAALRRDFRKIFGEFRADPRRFAK